MRMDDRKLPCKFHYTYCIFKLRKKLNELILKAKYIYLSNNFCFLSIALFFLALSCSLSLWWVGVFFSDYRVSPNFLVVLGLRLWLRLGLGCDNNSDRPLYFPSKGFAEPPCRRGGVCGNRICTLDKLGTEY